MRIFSLLTLCMAAISLSATGQTGQSTASAAPAKNVQVKNTVTQDAPFRRALAESTAPQNNPARTAPKQGAPALISPGGQNAPSEASPRLRVFPQMRFDKGIYAGRNALSGSASCLAIQSYNFSQAAPGRMPELQSITTCTSVKQPLMRQVRKPQAHEPEVQNQQEQEDPK